MICPYIFIENITGRYILCTIVNGISFILKSFHLHCLIKVSIWLWVANSTNFFSGGKAKTGPEVIKRFLAQHNFQIKEIQLTIVYSIYIPAFLYNIREIKTHFLTTRNHAVNAQVGFNLRCTRMPICTLC